MAVLAKIQFGGEAVPLGLPVPAWKVGRGSCVLMMPQLDCNWVPGSRTGVALWHGRLSESKCLKCGGKTGWVVLHTARF